MPTLRVSVAAAFLALSLLVHGGCHRSSISVAGWSSEVAAADGATLTAMTFTERRVRPEDRSKAIVVYVQGSEDRSVTEAMGALAGFCAMGAQVVAVERRGVSPDGTVDAEMAARSCTRELRVADTLTILDRAVQRAPEGTPLILLGASEGADVASAVAAARPQVSRVILLGGGGGWTQAEEFRHFVRTRTGFLASESEAALDEKLADIRAHPDSGEMWLGHPYRRWATFMFSRPADDLLKVECPILVVQGDADDSVPVESARLLRDAFAGAGKTNLRLVEIPGADHTFADPATGVSKRPLVEIEVIRFLSTGGLLTPLEASIYERRVRRNHPELFGKGS